MRLELFWRHLPERMRDIASLVAYLLVVIAVGALASQTWETALYSLQAGNRSVMTEIVLWPWRMIMPASLAIAEGIAHPVTLRADPASSRFALTLPTDALL